MDSHRTTPLTGEEPLNIERRLSQLSAERRELAYALLRAKGIRAEGWAEGPRLNPVSAEQFGLWLNHQFPANKLQYNEPVLIEIDGALSKRALERALNEIVVRHEILRTAFPHIEGTVYQKIEPHVGFDLNCELAWGLTGTELEKRLLREIHRPFDLETGPLWGHLLLTTGTDSHLLLAVLHHSVVDGHSLTVFWQELTSLYAAFATGEPVALVPLRAQYSRYCAAQAQYLAQHQDRLLRYWVERLSGVPQSRTQQSSGASAWEASRYRFTIPVLGSAELRKKASEQNQSVFMRLLAALSIILPVAPGETMLHVGTDFAQRDKPEFESLIGFFVNQIVLQIDHSGNPTFDELTKRVREDSFAAYCHHQLPFAVLAKSLAPGATGQPCAFFQTKAVWNQARPGAAKIAGVEWRLKDIFNGQAKFDLLWNFWDGPAIGVAVDHALDCYSVVEIVELSRKLESTIQITNRDSSVRVSELRRLVEDEVFEGRRKQNRLLKSMNLKKLGAMTGAERKIAGVPGVPQGSSPFPLVIGPDAGPSDLAGWSRAERTRVGGELLRHGAVLFRGFPIGSGLEFQRIVRAWLGAPISYRERSSLRTKILEGVYTSTEHPQDQSIFFHNENSYAVTWPLHILFFCELSATSGGRTPIADCREVLKHLSAETVGQFSAKGVRYVRNFRKGLGYSWEASFQVSSRGELEQFLECSGYTWEWHGEHLRTSREANAIVQHPETGESIWFNHAALFHASTLSPELRDMLLLQCGLDGFPLHCYYGDGSPISDETMAEIRAAYTAASTSFQWRAGDLLLLDNMLMAHGREAYSGPRRILTAMATPRSSL